MMSIDSLPYVNAVWLHLIVRPQDCKVEKNHNIIEIALVKHNPDGSVEEWSH